MDPDTLPGKTPYLLSADATALTGLLNTRHPATGAEQAVRARCPVG